MTLDEKKSLRQAMKSRVEYASALLDVWNKWKAIVRCTCGYTPKVMREMEWREMIDAYKDCVIYESIKR